MLFERRGSISSQRDFRRRPKRFESRSQSRIPTQSAFVTLAVLTAEVVDTIAADLPPDDVAGPN
jgi:hypothetical protein